MLVLPQERQVKQRQVKHPLASKDVEEKASVMATDHKSVHEISQSFQYALIDWS